VKKSKKLSAAKQLDVITVAATEFLHKIYQQWLIAHKIETPVATQEFSALTDSQLESYSMQILMGVRFCEARLKQAEIELNSNEQASSGSELK
jgi:hypothetical protein